VKINSGRKTISSQYWFLTLEIMKGKKLSAHHKTKCNIITTISIIIKIIVGFIMIRIIYTSKMIFLCTKQVHPFIIIIWKVKFGKDNFKTFKQ